MSDFIANVKAVLDDQLISTQIAALGRKPIVFSNVSINLHNLVSQIQDTIKSGNYAINIEKINTASVEKTAANLGKTISDGISSSVGSSLPNALLQNSTGAISNIQKAIESLDFGSFENASKAANEATKNLELMDLAITNIRTNHVIVITAGDHQSTIYIKENNV